VAPKNHLFPSCFQKMAFVRANRFLVAIKSQLLDCDKNRLAGKIHEVIKIAVKKKALVWWN